MDAAGTSEMVLNTVLSFYSKGSREVLYCKACTYNIITWLLIEGATRT